MTPTSLRILKALAMGGVTSLVLVACGGGSGNTGTSLAANQTLTFPILADFGTLDPAIADAETDTEISQNMFDGLVKFDKNLNIIPDLPSTAPSEDTTVLTHTS